MLTDTPHNTMRASRTDDNHRAIVQALRAAGCSVFDTSSLGRGFPDLVVGISHRTVLMEIKNPATRYGRAGLNENQRALFEGWKGGPMSIVTDVESALRAARTAS